MKTRYILLILISVVLCINLTSCNDEVDYRRQWLGTYQYVRYVEKFEPYTSYLIVEKGLLQINVSGDSNVIINGIICNVNPDGKVIGTLSLGFDTVGSRITYRKRTIQGQFLKNALDFVEIEGSSTTYPYLGQTEICLNAQSTPYTCKKIKDK